MGQAKLYGQKASGVDINGLIEDYYVYAGKKVNAGDFVEFLNGVASQTSATYTSNYTDLSIDGTYASYVQIYKAIRLSDTKVFVGYRLNSDSALYAQIITISNMTITSGSQYTLVSGTTADNSVSFTKIDDSTVLFTGEDSDDDARCALCIINGTSISTGSWLYFNDNTNAVYNSFTPLSSTSIFCAHCTGNSFYATSQVITRSGTALTSGTKYYVMGEATNNRGKFIDCQALSSTSAYVLYASGGRNTIATISGTTITYKSYYSSSVASGTSSNRQILFIDSTHLVLVGAYSSSGITACIKTISGTTISEGTVYTLVESGSYEAVPYVDYSKNSSKIIFVSNNKGFVVSYSPSALSVLSSPSAINISASVQSCIVVDDSSSDPSLFLGGRLDKKIGGQIFKLKNNKFVSKYTMINNVYETQVQKATTSNIYGVAKTEGTGGTSTAHKDKVSIYRPIVYNYINFTSSIAPTVWTDSSDYLSATASNDYGEWSIEATNYNSTSTRASLAVDGNSSGTWYQAEFASGTIPGYFTQNIPVKIKPTKITITYECFSDTSKVEGYNGTSWVDLGIVFTKSSARRTETFSISIDEYFEKIRISIFSAYSNAPTLGEFAITSGVIKILSN